MKYPSLICDDAAADGEEEEDAVDDDDEFNADVATHVYSRFAL